MKMSDKAAELQGSSLLTPYLKLFATLEHVSSDEHGPITAGTDKGLGAAIVSRKGGDSEGTAPSLSRQTCQL